MTSEDAHTRHRKTPEPLREREPDRGGGDPAAGPAPPRRAVAAGVEKKRVRSAEIAGHGTSTLIATVRAENSAALCDLRVFVEQAAEPITSDGLDFSVCWIGKRP